MRNVSRMVGVGWDEHNKPSLPGSGSCLCLCQWGGNTLGMCIVHHRARQFKQNTIQVVHSSHNELSTLRLLRFLGTHIIGHIHNHRPGNDGDEFQKGKGLTPRVV